MSAAPRGKWSLALAGAMVGSLLLPMSNASAAEGPNGSPSAGKVTASAMVPPAVAAAARPLLQYGSSQGPAVVYVQQRLGLPTTGNFGPLTQAKIRAFQALKKIPQTGNVGPLTWSAIFGTPGLIRVPALPSASTPARQGLPTRVTPRSGTPARPGVPTRVTPRTSTVTRHAPTVFTPAAARAAARLRPVLRPGAGPADLAVMFVQSRLYQPRTGFYGPSTTAAVRRYQAKMGLPTTGNVGPLTWEAMLTGRRPVPSLSESRGLPVSTPRTQVSSPNLQSPGTVIPAKVWLTGRPNPPVDPSKSPQANAIRFALAQVGEQYVLGGVGPDIWDCSGIIQTAYARTGVQLPRIATAQYIATDRVALTDLQPGDLLFYSTSPGRMTHVTMYIGNGMSVEAANSQRGVVTTPLSAPWFQAHFQAAGRIRR